MRQSESLGGKRRETGTRFQSSSLGNRSRSQEGEFVTSHCEGGHVDLFPTTLTSNIKSPFLRDRQTFVSQPVSCSVPNVPVTKGEEQKGS